MEAQENLNEKEFILMLGRISDALQRVLEQSCQNNVLTFSEHRELVSVAAKLAKIASNVQYRATFGKEMRE